MQSRDKHAVTCSPRLRFSRMRRQKFLLLLSYRVHAVVESNEMQTKSWYLVSHKPLISIFFWATSNISTLSSYFPTDRFLRLLTRLKKSPTHQAPPFSCLWRSMWKCCLHFRFVPVDFSCSAFLCKFAITDKWSATDKIAVALNYRETSKRNGTKRIHDI